MLCLTMTGRTLEENLKLKENLSPLVDLFELRIDLLESIDIPQIAEFSRSVEKPLILTCRRERDGGAYKRTDRTRASQLAQLLESGRFSYVDLEEDFRRSELEQRAQQRGIEIIRSFHDTASVPSDLFTRMDRIARRGEIPKAAVTADSISNVLTIFSARQQLKELSRYIILSMGDWGVPTRILYKLTGSFLTYVSPEGMPAASGHLDAQAMKHLFRADQVDDRTKIYGIIGNPVMHSASPKIHNPAYMKLGMNAVYVPFLVDDVRTFFSLADLLGISGFSVTVPHKQHVLPYLGKITREVKQIGSCNTVVWEREYWKGVNTDYYGFLKPIYEDLEGERIKKAVVLGSGGSARSVVWALRNHQCSVTILNRTVEKAARLARETGASWGGLDELEKIREADLIVQTTSVGMIPNDGQDPIEAYQFRGDEVLYELIYAPEKTKLMKRAEAAGCRLISGKEMLRAQGILQFETFTGLTFPLSEAEVVF